MWKRTEDDDWDEVWEYARSLSVCISQSSSPPDVAYSLLTAGKYKVSENLLCEPLRMLLGMSNSLVVNKYEGKLKPENVFC